MDDFIDYIEFDHYSSEEEDQEGECAEPIGEKIKRKKKEALDKKRKDEYAYRIRNRN